MSALGPQQLEQELADATPPLSCRPRLITDRGALIGFEVVIKSPDRRWAVLYIDTVTHTAVLEDDQSSTALDPEHIVKSVLEHFQSTPPSEHR